MKTKANRYLKYNADRQLHANIRLITSVDRHQ